MPPSHTDPGNAGSSPVRVSRDGVCVRVSTAGGPGRTKTVTVTGDPLRVTERLTAWTETLD